MTAGNRVALAGWGATSASVADRVEVAPAELPGLVSGAVGRGVLARGLGRSYGDAAQNGGGLVVSLADEGDRAVLNRSAARVTASGGTSLDALLRVLVPAGFFVPVTPGTRFVTVGGAIASDIHGKNHHVDGSFGSHVHELDLLLADGTVRTVGPHRDPEVFWATVGGMGLTGIILSATFAVIPIETSHMSVETRRLGHLDDLLAAMDPRNDDSRYSVAWIDPLASGSSLGRSVLTRGEHAPLAALPDRDAESPLRYEPAHWLTLPKLMPPRGVVNRWSVAAFNEMWYRKAPRHRVGELQSLTSYFHPLDAVGRWNRVYGRRGLVQYQFVVPPESHDVLRVVLERLSAAGAASFLAVLKRFGDANPAVLSFPTPGWTLALDVPASNDVALMFHELDELVLGAGGRHYLAKDSHTTPDAIRRGYPRLDEWRDVQRRLDPGGRWQSDLARRLELLEAR